MTHSSSVAKVLEQTVTPKDLLKKFGSYASFQKTKRKPERKSVEKCSVAFITGALVVFMALSQSEAKPEYASTRHR